MKRTISKSFFLLVVCINFTLVSAEEVTSKSVSSCVSISKPLSRGSENDQVLLLQNFLFDGGYLSAKPNGYFGAGTMNAVKKFQSANGLSPIGSVGPGTRLKIREKTCGSAGGTTKKSNISDQQISVWKDKLKVFCATDESVAGQEFEAKLLSMLRESLSVGKEVDDKSFIKMVQADTELGKTLQTPEMMSCIKKKLNKSSQSTQLLQSADSLANSRNAERRSGVNTILNGVTQYAIDNNGVLPSGITTTAVEICATGAVSCAGYVDLSVITTNGKYLAAIPNEPQKIHTQGAGYMIQRGAGGRVTVSSQYAELGATIMVTR